MDLSRSDYLADSLPLRAGDHSKLGRGERAAEPLPQATARWLRHTADSHMMDHQVDLRYVRDNPGPCLEFDRQSVSVRG